MSAKRPGSCAPAISIDRPDDSRFHSHGSARVAVSEVRRLRDTSARLASVAGLVISAEVDREPLDLGCVLFALERARLDVERAVIELEAVAS